MKYDINRLNKEFSDEFPSIFGVSVLTLIQTTAFNPPLQLCLVPLYQLSSVYLPPCRCRILAKCIDRVQMEDNHAKPTSI